MKAPLGVGCQELRDRLLLPDDEFQLRNEIDDEAATGLRRMVQSLASPVVVHSFIKRSLRTIGSSKARLGWRPSTLIVGEYA